MLKYTSPLLCVMLLVACVVGSAQGAKSMRSSGRTQGATDIVTTCVDDDCADEVRVVPCIPAYESCDEGGNGFCDACTLAVGTLVMTRGFEPSNNCKCGDIAFNPTLIIAMELWNLSGPLNARVPTKR